MSETKKPKLITGVDLENLRERLALSVTDFTWLFGFTMPIWSQITDRRPDPDDPDQVPSNRKPVRDPSVALLARYLMLHPEDCPVHPSPTPADVLDRLNMVLTHNNLNEFGRKYAATETPETSPVTKKMFGVCLGREATAGYRWTKLHGSTPPILNRLLSMLLRQMVNNPDRVWADWIDNVVRVEAEARGIPDVFSEGNWRKDEISPQRRRRKKTADGEDGPAAAAKPARTKAAKAEPKAKPAAKPKATSKGKKAAATV